MLMRTAYVHGTSPAEISTRILYIRDMEFWQIVLCSRVMTKFERPWVANGSALAL